MRNILIVLLSVVQFVSCNTGTENRNTGSVQKNDTLLLSFSVINKDSAHVVNYRFEKLPGDGQGFSFNYANESDSFTLLLDTSKGNYSGKFGGGGVVNLDLEGAKFYTINGSSFKVLKLVGDKNMTDGAFSIFLSPDFGLLVSKSNTWRTAKVICPNKSGSNYVQLSVLLYRVQTDEEFFPNPVPAIDKNIKPPRVE
jgi:hypothetical protein